MSSRAPAIGIDLGTTHSCVAVFRHGKVEVIANDVGSRTTPSVVAFTDTELMIGTAAVNQAARNLDNTVFDAKRIIGRKFSDPKLQEDMKHWPFAVVESEDQTMIQMSINHQSHMIRPEMISAMVLTKMRETAEAFLGEEVKNAVITVPAYFNDQQRKSTKDAGIIAGLNVLRIINEPTAAAIAYGLNQKSEKERNILVFDLGGGTFDVSVLSMKEGTQIVKATFGDTHLGGEDFDNRLVDHVVAECKRKHRVDLTGNKRAVRRLRIECEKAKRTLSTNTHANVEVLFDGDEFLFNVSKACFEDLNRDLFQATIDCVKKVLEDAKMDKKAIDEIVLVGGSTRIPKVQKMLQEFFDGKELNKTINPDEAVACGAAVHAAVLNSERGKQEAGMMLIDVAPLSLGIMAGSDNRMNVVVPRNTVIPNKMTKRVVTFSDNQTQVGFSVYEGERPFVKDNNLLGKFLMYDVKPAPAGVEQFDVTFDINENGILTVSAVDIRSGNHKGITIANDGRLSKATIEKMIKDAEKFRLEDHKTMKRNSVKMELESYCINIRGFFKSNKKISENEKLKVLEQCSGAVLWLDTNQTAEPEEYERRLQALEALCKPMIDKYKNQSSAYKKDVNLGNVD